MDQAVLLIDANETRRRAMARVLQRSGVPFVEGADTFHAMAVLGRADFGAAIMAEESRHLAMRGFMMLARKRHPDIRLIVIMGPGNAHQALKDAVGVTLECIHPDAPLDSVLGYVIHALGTQQTPFDVPTTTQVTLAVHDAVTLERREDTVPNYRPPAALEEPPVTAPAATHAMMEGVLDQESGSALLMAIYGQELTGRLIFDSGPAEGALFFLRGEPVWAEDARGDAGLFDRLMAKGWIPAGVSRPDTQEGLMLSTLAQHGVLGGEAIHNAMREMVRGFVLALCQVQRTHYRFIEDRSFLDTTPLLKINPVGLMLEAQRRSLLPEQLLEQSQMLARHHVVAAPGLSGMAVRLMPFTRGKDVTAILAAGTTVEEFCRQSGLDNIMGTLVLLTLRDARLVMVDAGSQSRLGSSVVLKAIPSQPADPVLPEADMEMRARGASSDIRNSVLSLYARLKPLNQPTSVLGVRPYASVQEIENAYQRRLAEVDSHVPPPGPEQALLTSRLDELRKKLQAARAMLMAQSGADPGRDPSNPF